MTETIETHPVQHRHTPSRIATAITMRAYEVYREVYGPQTAMITGDCRGGFSGGELIAFLYARSFPQNEWRKRVEEAIRSFKEARI